MGFLGGVDNFPSQRAQNRCMNDPGTLGKLPIQKPVFGADPMPPSVMGISDFDQTILL